MPKIFVPFAILASHHGLGCLAVPPSFIVPRAYQSPPLNTTGILDGMKFVRLTSEQNGRKGVLHCCQIEKDRCGYERKDHEFTVRTTMGNHSL